jgi:hypothetical protein
VVGTPRQASGAVESKGVLRLRNKFAFGEFVAPLRMTKRKKPGPEDGPGKCWLVARINLRRLRDVSLCRNPEPRPLRRRIPSDSYAVRRGRIVKSRTWVRMLDICIPFSCDTNGSISAMNESFINSITSS